MEGYYETENVENKGTRFRYWLMQATSSEKRRKVNLLLENYYAAREQKNCRGRKKMQKVQKIQKYSYTRVKEYRSTRDRKV